ncbi:hypothetical protein D3C79_901860 [compost metagenome]
MQITGDIVLQRHVEGGIGGQVHAVQIVELHPELTAEAGTCHLQPLVVIDPGDRRRLQEVAETELGL